MKTQHNQEKLFVTLFFLLAVTMFIRDEQTSYYYELIEVKK